MTKPSTPATAKKEQTTPAGPIDRYFPRVVSKKAAKATARYFNTANYALQEEEVQRAHIEQAEQHVQRRKQELIALEADLDLDITKFKAFWRANRVEGCILNGVDPETPDAADANDATEPESDDEQCAGMVYPRRAQSYTTWPASGSQ